MKKPAYYAHHDMLINHDVRLLAEGGKAAQAFASSGTARRTEKDSFPCTRWGKAQSKPPGLYDADFVIVC